MGRTLKLLEIFALSGAILLSLGSAATSQRPEPTSPPDALAAQAAPPGSEKTDGEARIPAPPQSAAPGAAARAATAAATPAPPPAPAPPAAPAAAPAQPAGATVAAAPPLRSERPHVAPLLVEGEALSNLTRITSEPSSYWPVVSPDGSFLVYVVRGEAEGTDLVLKRNFAGSAVTRLTSYPGVEKQPAVSPDGKRVVFAANLSGNFDIYIISLGGGTARRVVTDSPADEEFPDWSPDGRLIAYSARSLLDGRWYVWTKDLQTGAPTQYGEGLYPRFSPDGKRILFQRPAPGPDGLFALWTMDLEGADLTQLTESRDWGAIQPRWSPDGSHIVFCSATGDAARWYTRVQPDGGVRTVALSGGTHLWTMRSDGSELTQLTRHAADDWYPFWTRNDELFFTTTRDGTMRIWKMSLPPPRRAAARMAPPAPPPLAVPRPPSFPAGEPSGQPPAEAPLPPAKPAVPAAAPVESPAPPAGLDAASSPAGGPLPSAP